jgi:hypothetical protein
MSELRTFIPAEVTIPTVRGNQNEGQLSPMPGTADLLRPLPELRTNVRIDARGQRLPSEGVGGQHEIVRAPQTLVFKRK